MSHLFEAGAINVMKLKNRFVRSATWEAMADESGACTPELINLIVELAGDLTKAACVSDNLCFLPARAGEGIYCVTEEREKAQAE